jgi:ferritin heavy chain
LEQTITTQLRKVHDVASQQNDAHLTDFIEAMLEEQIRSVKQLSDFVTQVRRVGDGVGVFLWDQELLRSSEKLSRK